MRRSATARFLTLVTAAVICLAAPALAAATTRVQIRHTGLGMILVNNRGQTLYAFTRDARNRDRCASIRGCPSVWPLLTTNGSTIAGTGVNRRLLGSIRVAHSHQVTYAGHPLYTYVGDSGPGDTAYVGFSQFGGTWYALSPPGKLVR